MTCGVVWFFKDNIVLKLLENLWLVSIASMMMVFFEVLN